MLCFAVMETTIRRRGRPKKAEEDVVLGADSLVSYGVAARWIGCHKNTIYNWVRDGYLKLHMDGRMKKVRMGDVLAVKNGGAVEAKAALANG